jgi:hypothetical protein
MNYDEALWYLDQLDTVPACDSQYTQAISKAREALRDCLEMGLTGEDGGATRWELAGEIHVQHDPRQP